MLSFVESLLGLDLMRLSPKESRNKAVGRCRRDVLQDKERCRVAL
jgi:hypothetical protein